MIEESKDEFIPSDPFLTKAYIDNYCSEKVPAEYLTKEDILELGFLRNDPQRTMYRHARKPNLYLLKVAYHNYSKKDVMDERVEMFSHNGKQIEELYSSNKPVKADIQKIINNYAS